MLELLGEDLAICFSEVVAAHWVEEPVAEASASGSLDSAPESSVTTSIMEDTVHALVDEPYSGFRRKARLRQARPGAASRRLSQE
jgi:hypothetical protein